MSISKWIETIIRHISPESIINVFFGSMIKIFAFSNFLRIQKKNQNLVEYTPNLLTFDQIDQRIGIEEGDHQSLRS